MEKPSPPTLSKVQPFLSRCNLEMVIHAFTLPLHYCNSLLFEVGQGPISRLQIVKNAAAQFLTGQIEHEHIPGVMASLHWFQIQFRVIFRFILIVSKSVKGLCLYIYTNLFSFVFPLALSGQLTS